MNLEAVAGLPARPVASVWYRAVIPQHLPTALACSHTRLFASRFYEGPTAPEPFETFYLAENPIVAQFEVKALFGSPLTPGGLVSNPACSWLIANVEVQLAKIVDLTVLTVSQSLLTTAQELTGDWQGYQQRRQNRSAGDFYRYRSHARIRRRAFTAALSSKVSLLIPPNCRTT